MLHTIVIYKSKYGATKTYADWIGEELSCRVVEAGEITAEELTDYNAIVYGGGLYAEIINGLRLLTKNIELLNGKKVAVFTTGITPLDCRAYYDQMVVEKNFKNGVPNNIKLFNFTGKMILDELSLVHRTALKSLKKIMLSKKEPTEMEQLLISLCDADGDFTDRTQIAELISYITDSE